MHSHSHAHDHPHSHGGDARGPRLGRAFAAGIALNVAFVIAEVILGLMANSLALVADAMHNLSDVVGLVLAWGASALALRPPSARFTYGFRGSTILAALANAMLLLVVTGGIAWEALHRLKNPGIVNETLMIWVAIAGIVINGVTAWFFMADRKSDLNVRGAYLHMAADAGVSAGVALAGAGMLLTGWLWLDPAVSLVIVATIFVGTWGLLRDSVKLALHAAPESVDPGEVRGYLCALKGVAEVHDLHIWGMSTTETALTAHLVMPAGHPGDDFIAHVVHDIEHRFRIGHVTIQIEMGTSANPCALAPDHVV
ncbi:MAG TPA: cation diffusion facilitator family transporter [Burkholderiales bacterium]|nr:cation diffusion facilitator family transporter [Burkholderiales bacterium]